MFLSSCPHTHTHTHARVVAVHTFETVKWRWIVRSEGGPWLVVVPVEGSGSGDGGGRGDRGIWTPKIGTTWTYNINKTTRLYSRICLWYSPILAWNPKSHNSDNTKVDCANGGKQVISYISGTENYNELVRKSVNSRAEYWYRMPDRNVSVTKLQKVGRPDGNVNKHCTRDKISDKATKTTWTTHLETKADW